MPFWTLGTRPTETQIATVTSSIKQLIERGTLLRGLDNQIAVTIGTEDDISSRKLHCISLRISNSWFLCFFAICGLVTSLWLALW